MSIPYPGLTSAEVAERIRLGQVNHVPRSAWRAYAGIVSHNVCTLFNAMVTPAAIALFWLEKYQGGIAVSAMAVVNSAVGLFQEIKAKRHLDKLAILIETKATVRRDGQVLTIPAARVVLGDLLVVVNGDTIVADGTVIEARFLEMDEALLTGESDPVRHRPATSCSRAASAWPARAATARTKSATKHLPTARRRPPATTATRQAR